MAASPAALAQSGGDIWIADQQDGTLLRLAPRHGEVTRFGLGGHLSALAAAGGGLWAAIDAAGASHRGGTLTAVYPHAEVNTIDPAVSTSNDTSPPQFLGLTNDGLVTLNHVAGPDGTRLVPDLALALPAPTGNGRTYTFRLRPGNPLFDRRARPAQRRHPLLRAPVPARRLWHVLLPGHQRRRRVPQNPRDL